MDVRLRDLPAMLRTAPGRTKLLQGFYWRRAWPLLSRLAVVHRRTLARDTRVVAVVGSFGKTTTTRAVMAALGKDRLPEAGLNSLSHVAAAILLIRPRQRHAVVEVGIAGRGEMARYTRVVRPNVTVVTSIGSEHSRSLRTLEVTRAEKSEMVRILPPSGLAVLNGDDPNVRWMQGQTRAAVRTFGLDAGSDVRATKVAIDWPHGTRFTLHADGETRTMRTRLLGQPGVYAILAAVTVALAEGLTLEVVLPRLEALTATPGRLQVIRLPNGAFLLRDDFKSSTETIDVALDVLGEIPARRRIVVLADVSEPSGGQGPTYRRLGERIARVATRAIIVGRHWQRYAAGATHAGLPRETFVNAGPSVCTAVELVKADLLPGDVVLIKGRVSQRLARVALGLQGREVRCDIDVCTAGAWTPCHRCPMLERGWDGLRVVM